MGKQEQRDHLAALAMQGLLFSSAHGFTQNFSEIAQDAYNMADAMMARKKALMDAEFENKQKA